MQRDVERVERVTRTRKPGAAMFDLDTAVARAHELIAFCDGLEDAGQADTARRSRMVARDLIEIAEQLRAERSACSAAQANYERCLNILGRQADEPLRRELARQQARRGSSAP
jgi:hypothetical protein